MKTIHFFLGALLLPVIALAKPSLYNYSINEQDLSSLYVSETEDTSRIDIADSQIIIVENDSTVKVKVRTKDSNVKAKSSPSETKTYNDVDVEIVENGNGTRLILHKGGDTIQQIEMNFDEFAISEKKTTEGASKKVEDEKTITFSKKKSKKRKFKGHWSGFEMGINNYMTEDQSMVPSNPYMEINTSKSMNFNLNFAQVSLPIIRDRVGIVSGLGLEWNNYHFSNGNTITKDGTTHKIVEKPLTGIALKKNRLQTTYLTAPLLLEAQLGGRNSKRISISGGVIAGLKIGSHTKYKTSDDKVKVKDDFYLNTFRYGLTARVLYDDFGLYVNYYNVPLFMNSKGPETLYPIAAGIVFSFD